MGATHAALRAAPQSTRTAAALAASRATSRVYLRSGLMAGLMAGLTALAGCASGPGATPPRSPSANQPAARPPALPAPAVVAPPGADISSDASRDGPGANPPPNLLAVPDAEPQLEPVRSGGPNKPYEVLGQAYTPLAGDPPLRERGLASWYGRKFHGRSTANGETYNMYAMTAAHKTMPLPSYARVRNPANGREVVVRINDRGPFHPARVIDLSYTAAAKLGLLAGLGLVEIERITYQAIRTGAWRDPAAATLAGSPAGNPADNPPLPVVSLASAAPRPDADADADAASAPDPIARFAQVTLPPETTAPASAAARAARGFWLQLGAFGQRDGAMGFQQRVASEVSWLAPLLAIFTERNLHRLQAGPYASRSDALSAAQRLRVALSLVPAIVERR